jgi:hypothetical protein
MGEMYRNKIVQSICSYAIPIIFVTVVISLVGPFLLSQAYSQPLPDNTSNVSIIITPPPKEGLPPAPMVGCSSGNTALQSYNIGPWFLRYQIVNGEGLVFSDIRVGTERLLQKVSIPHFRINYSTSDGTILPKNIRFCDVNDPSVTTVFEAFPTIRTNDRLLGINTISWGYTQTFSSQSGLSGELYVKYDLVIRSKNVYNCEASAAGCLRFIPKVTFTWNGIAGSSSTPESVTAFYRLDYGPNVALVKVQDGNWLITSPYSMQPIQTNEQLFNAVTNGNAGRYDNLHNAHTNENVKIPGCRTTHFNCIHMHWRWGDVHVTGYGRPLDPLVEPTNDANLTGIVTRGTPYLVPGQTIDIALTRFNPAEESYPDDPSVLVNGESMARYAGEHYTVGSANNPVVWYMATAKDKNTDTFFRHGIFVLDRASIP